MKKKNEKRISIYVNKEDIEEGSSLSNSCPIARAIKRKFPFGGACVSVTEDDIAFAVDGFFKTFTPPPAAVKFIERFDGGDEVKPFSFSLYHRDV